MYFLTDIFSVLSNIVLCFLISLALKWHIYKHSHIKIMTNHNYSVFLIPLPHAVGDPAGRHMRSGARVHHGTKNAQQGLVDGR